MRKFCKKHLKIKITFIFAKLLFTKNLKSHIALIWCLHRSLGDVQYLRVKRALVITRSDKNRYYVYIICGRLFTLLFLLSSKLFTVNNQSLRAKRTYFILILRLSGLGYLHQQQQYQFHSSMIPPEVYIE